ncbi:MAG TPA: OB-fold domain-containing protein [Rubrobacter sp.]
MNQEDGEAPAEIYQRYLESDRLAFQRCAGCGAAVFYPRVLCHICGSPDLAWETSSGRGTVYATTAVYRRDADPYNVVLVDLEEGFRMMSRVEGVPAEEVQIGTRVAFKIDRGDDGPVPVFVPEDR